MARHTLEKKKAETPVDTLRKNALAKFFGLTDKVMKHVEWSIEATKPCSACTYIEGQGYKAGKAKTEDGRCALCLNTGLVPDVQQRNWATGEIAPRIAPAPKAVEMSVDTTNDRAELEAEISQLGQEVLDLQLKNLGVTVSESEG